MKNQQLTTALLALVLPILGACSNPVTLETNTASTPKVLRSQAAANIVPNAVWRATHNFSLGAFYNNIAFATNINGVNIRVQYPFLDSRFDSQKLEFRPGAQANTLVSSAFSYIGTRSRAKITGGLPNCTYSLGPQEFSVPANSITITFDPTYTADQYEYGYNPLSIVGKDWIYFDVQTNYEVVSVDANLQSVCLGPSKGQTTTTQIPVTLSRTSQPTYSIIHWSTHISISNEFVNPNLLDMAFGTFPSGGAHLWR
jgi:hypothetical protein